MKENVLLLKDLLELQRAKSKTIKYLTSISKNTYCKLTDIVKEYNNTYHRTIKMKPINVKSRQVLTLA